MKTLVKEPKFEYCNEHDKLEAEETIKTIEPLDSCKEVAVIPWIEEENKSVNDAFFELLKSSEEAMETKGRMTQVIVELMRASGEITEAKEIQKAIKQFGSYEGMVQILVKSPTCARHIENLRKNLCQVKNLHLEWYGWDESKGHVIAVSAEKPVPLTYVLGKMSFLSD